MRSRLTGGLIVLLALLSLAVPASAQDDEQAREDAAEEVLRDYRDDGVIDACDHTRRALRDALRDLPEAADLETPDLRPALEAGIEQVKADECEDEEQQQDEEQDPAPTATATPAPTAAPSPAPNTGGNDSTGSVTPPAGDGGGNGGGGGNGREGVPGADDVTPLAPEATAVPPATAPAPVAPAPAEPSGAPPPPVYANADDPLPVSLLVLGGVLTLLAVLALLYALISRLGWGERRLAGVRRATREALFRAGGTWGDFADWLRVGR